MRAPKISRRTLLGAGAATAAAVAVGVNSMAADAAPATTTSTSKTGKAAPGAGSAKTLVLYDTTNDYGWLGEVYATQTANWPRTSAPGRPRRSRSTSPAT